MSLPVIANGEIWSSGDALRCRQVSGCDDLMLGRGALCRPDLPRLVVAAVRGEPLHPMHWSDIVPLVLTFFELKLAHYDAGHAGNPLKQWLVYLRGYFPQAALLFERIKRLRQPEEIQAVLQAALANQDGFGFDVLSQTAGAPSHQSSAAPWTASPLQTAY